MASQVHCRVVSPQVIQPQMNSSITSATNTQIFRARCPSQLSQGLSHDGDRPSRTHLRLFYDGDRPSRTHLQDALSARPPLWQSHDDVWPWDSHECPSVDGHRVPPLLHPAVIDQSVLCPGPGTCPQAPPARRSRHSYAS
jgi:hypothetical protein